MFKHRKLLILAILLVAAAAVGFVLYHHSTQVPEAARLLPEGDLIVYANLKPVHLFDLNKSGPINPEGDYKDFIDRTGIQPERDIDEVAMSRRDTPDGRDVESSEILIGHFDQNRLRDYLQLLSSTREPYRNYTIYSIAHEGHTVRVALLDGGKVAITNMVSPEPMHGIIDRSLKPSAGPVLLSHYSDVPLGSLAWLIDRIPNKPDNVQLPGGFAITLPAEAVAVGSLRYTGSLLCVPMCLRKVKPRPGRSSIPPILIWRWCGALDSSSRPRGLIRTSKRRLTACKPRKKKMWRFSPPQFRNRF